MRTQLEAPVLGTSRQRGTEHRIRFQAAGAHHGWPILRFGLAPLNPVKSRDCSLVSISTSKSCRGRPTCLAEMPCRCHAVPCRSLAAPRTRTPLQQTHTIPRCSPTSIASAATLPASLRLWSTEPAYTSPGHPGSDASAPTGRQGEPEAPRLRVPSRHSAPSPPPPLSAVWEYIKFFPPSLGLCPCSRLSHSAMNELECSRAI